MSSGSDKVVALRRLLDERFPAAHPREPRLIPTGVPAVDRLLAGGLVIGTLTEFVSAVPSGGSQLSLGSLLLSTRLARQRVALVDAAGSSAIEPAGSRPFAYYTAANEQSWHPRSSPRERNEMTGKELWKEYQHYTRDFTEHARKLGFAGAAVCWLFRDSAYRFPLVIYGALLFFVGYFIADILHALFAALTIRQFVERQEAKMWKASGSIDGNIDKPRWVDWPATIMFLIKAGLLLLGFGSIGVELLRRLL